MTRIDDFICDLELLINEHYELQRAIEEIARYKEAIKNIKAEIHQNQWYVDVHNANWLIEIIDKYISPQAESEDKE